MRSGKVLVHSPGSMSNPRSRSVMTSRSQSPVGGFDRVLIEERKRHRVAAVFDAFQQKHKLYKRVIACMVTMFFVIVGLSGCLGWFYIHTGKTLSEFNKEISSRPHQKAIEKLVENFKNKLTALEDSIEALKNDLTNYPDLVKNAIAKAHNEFAPKVSSETTNMDKFKQEFISGSEKLRKDFSNFGSTCKGYETSESLHSHIENLMIRAESLDLNSRLVNLESEFTQAIAAAIPNGFMYWTFPDASHPNSLWPNDQWEDISNNDAYRDKCPKFALKETVRNKPTSIKLKPEAVLNETDFHSFATVRPPSADNDNLNLETLQSFDKLPIKRPVAFALYKKTGTK